MIDQIKHGLCLSRTCWVGQVLGGGNARDNRQFINAVLWILRTGAPWRDWPPDYGSWSNTHRRFIRWRDKGIWESLLTEIMQDTDFEWLMVDATHCKVHLHAAGAVGGNQAMSRTKGGLNTKIHLAVDQHGLPVRAMITEGAVTDCTKAIDCIHFSILFNNDVNGLF